MTVPEKNLCTHSEATHAYALGVMPGSERAEIEAHIAVCPGCRRELDALRVLVKHFAAWPADVLQPDPSVQNRLAERLAGENGQAYVRPPSRKWSEPEWEEAAPGIECKLLANDREQRRVSMLVRLAPGASYPPHTHAGVEELHLLEGELWIDDRKLVPGDYNYGPPGAADFRVWSETGCTCVLVTSTDDVIGSIASND